MNNERKITEVSQVLLSEKQFGYVARKNELTFQEKHIVELIFSGLKNNVIAQTLRIQPGTVKTHLRNIYRKTRVKSKPNLIIKFLIEARELNSGG